MFLQRDYLDKETLFQKLKFEFRYKHAINSYQHPYMVTISSLRQVSVLYTLHLQTDTQAKRIHVYLYWLRGFFLVTLCSDNFTQGLASDATCRYINFLANLSNWNPTLRYLFEFIHFMLVESTIFYILMICRFLIVLMMLLKISNKIMRYLLRFQTVKWYHQLMWVLPKLVKFIRCFFKKFHSLDILFLFSAFASFCVVYLGA